MDEQKRSDKIGRSKAFGVGEQVIDLNAALLRFFENNGYTKLEINKALENVETSKWIEGLFDWVCEGKTIDTNKLTGFVEELLNQ